MPGNDLIQSIERAAAALRVLAHAETSWVPLRQVAEALGLGPSTVHNILRTLGASGMVEARGGAYRLGPAIVEMAASRLRQGLGERAREVVRALEARLRPAVVLFAQPTGPHVAALVRMSPDRPGVVQAPIGHMLSPYLTVTGLVVQAYADRETLEALRTRHPFWEEGAQVWGGPKKLDAYLRRVRRQALAVAPFGQSESIRAAAPVFSYGRAFAGALGVHVDMGSGRRRIEESKVAEAVRRAASDISESEDEQ